MPNVASYNLYIFALNILIFSHNYHVCVYSYIFAHARAINNFQLCHTLNDMHVATNCKCM